MPMLNSIKRRLIENLAGLVNELHIGSDGTIASSEDGGARTIARVTPTVTIIDDSSILIEGSFNTSHVYSSAIKEVYIQYKDPTTSEFVPVYRTDINPFTKNAQNEVRFSFIMELD
jgi:hypothetical protein|tara:strand:- start:1256 stop:1603 length:348 start_codon:yes stop_codon:yes gene_type:complete